MQITRIFLLFYGLWNIIDKSGENWLKIHKSKCCLILFFFHQKRCILFVSLMLLAFLSNECWAVSWPKWGNSWLESVRGSLSWPWHPIFCLVNISSPCTMIFLPEGLLCHHMALPAPASLSFPWSGAGFMKPLLFWLGFWQLLVF